MNYTINEIPDEAVELSGNEMMPIWQGETKKVSVVTLVSSGIPVGAVMAFAQGTTNKNWLLCDGRDTTGTADELQTHYPALYTYLGNSNVLPDYRECVLVGVGQNTTDTIAEHDPYTLGEFKDDQLQKHGHSFQQEGGTPPSGVPVNSKIIFGGGQTSAAYNTNAIQSTSVIDARTGTTTHGKQKGVAYYIKAK